MTLESFPNKYLDVLLGVIKDNPEDYKMISVTKIDENNSNIELQGIEEPYDLFELGIRIGIDYADRRSIERIVPHAAALVKKDLEQSPN